MGGVGDPHIAIFRVLIRDRPRIRVGARDMSAVITDNTSPASGGRSLVIQVDVGNGTCRAPGNVLGLALIPDRFGTDRFRGGQIKTTDQFYVKGGNVVNIIVIIVSDPHLGRVAQDIRRDRPVV